MFFSLPENSTETKVGGLLHFSFAAIVGGTERNMASLLLWLFSIGALFFSSNAQDTYDKLSEPYKKGVDLVLENLNSRTGMVHHFLFFKSVQQSDIEHGFDVSFIYHHFYCKATNCPKGTADTTRCQFRNDRPLIDCAICYKTFRGDIEQEPKPYIHCVHKPAYTADMKQTRVDHCNLMTYSSGAATLLASTANQ